MEEVFSSFLKINHGNISWFNKSLYNGGTINYPNIIQLEGKGVRSMIIELWCIWQKCDAFFECNIISLVADSRQLVSQRACLTIPFTIKKWSQDRSTVELFGKNLKGGHPVDMKTAPGWSHFGSTFFQWRQTRHRWTDRWTGRQCSILCFDLALNEPLWNNHL